MDSLADSILARIHLLNQLVKDTDLLALVNQAGTLLRDTVWSGHTVLVCGNGGSAAEAQHLVGEIVGRFLVERGALPAIALTADSTVLTAVSNDFGFENVFARQISAFQSAKLLFLLSTSGNSENLVRAANVAKNNGMTTVALLGRDGGKLGGLCDIVLLAPSWNTAEIQEIHLILVHLLCACVDGEFK